MSFSAKLLISSILLMSFPTFAALQMVCTNNDKSIRIQNSHIVIEGNQFPFYAINSSPFGFLPYYDLEEFLKLKGQKYFLDESKEGLKSDTLKVNCWKSNGPFEDQRETKRYVMFTAKLRIIDTSGMKISPDEDFTCEETVESHHFLEEAAVEVACKELN